MSPSMDETENESPLQAEQRCRKLKVRNLTLVFLALATVVLFFGLNYPLIDRTETRVAEIAREVLVTNDWATLHLNFQPYYDKPPLLYWLCALSFKAFGTNQLAARLIPAVCSLLTITCTVFFSSRWFGKKVGLLSGVVLFLSSGFVVLSRFLATDGLLALFASLTAFAGYEAIRSLSYTGSLENSHRQNGMLWMLACGASCGFGFLSKGPVIGVLCGVPFLFAIFVLNRKRRFRWLSIGWAVLAFACVGLPWMAWVAIYDPQYLTEFFLQHNVNRFGGEFHQKPFWYFIPVLLAGSHPWSFMTIPLLTQMFTRNNARELITKPAIYLVVTGLWCVLFFSLSGCKLPTYILPAAAPLSIVTGAFLNTVLSDKSMFAQKRLAQKASPQMATWATILGVVAYMIYSPIAWSSTGTWLLGVVLATTLALLGGGASWLARSSPERSWLVTGSVTLVFSMWLSYCVIPNYAKQTTCRVNFQEDSFIDRHGGAKVITLIDQFPDVPFYSGRNDVQNVQVMDQAFLAALRSEGTSVMLYVPIRVEPGFLKDNSLSYEKVFTNSRYAVYYIPEPHNSISSPPRLSRKSGAQPQG